MSRPSADYPIGIAPFQERARLLAGVPLERVRHPKPQELAVPGIVANECAECGAANPFVVGAKRPETCSSCGSACSYVSAPADSPS